MKKKKLRRQLNVARTEFITTYAMLTLQKTLNARLHNEVSDLTKRLEAMTELFKEAEENRKEFEDSAKHGERCIGKLRELAHSRGWNGVENSKILEVFLEQHVVSLESTLCTVEQHLLNLQLHIQRNSSVDRECIDSYVNDSLEAIRNKNKR